MLQNQIMQIPFYLKKLSYRYFTIFPLKGPNIKIAYFNCTNCLTLSLTLQGHYKRCWNTSWNFLKENLSFLGVKMVK